ncbi:23928_t:CDS:2 [Dentiscutata erythropus]|uniref:23928_t:CDS:1 n=1 Tax=Dentiscutata erythropus TaxID=1348616 RepID=A0A9N9NB60_9GLOM|nr:23928_t:CDS:2 [Dentiscutata erythropus]
MSESKYSFPNPTPPYDSKSMSFKSHTDQNMSPSHSAIPSYLTAQRRGSITDPSLHMSVPNPELARQYSQPDVNFPSNSGSGSSERRSSFISDQFPPSPFSSLSRSSSVKGEQSIQSFSPLETRKLRDALPSISASASPVRDGFPGPLMNPAFQAQLQPRRHSIAVGEVVAPLKRKNNIVTPAPTQPIMPEGYPVKRRESVGDPSIQRLSLYDRRNSYSAPSSPPAPPSSSLSNSLPKLNVQDVESSLQTHNESCALPTSYNDNVPDHPGANNMSTSHIGEQNDISIAYPHFSNPRLSQIVQEEVSAPILARRASMPVMTFPSRFTESVQQDGVPMDETPYSRSPELRISHKLAERKRRKEMKELFDELRDSLPVDKSLKTSKWEILSKAVDFINTLKHNQDEMAKEVETLRQQLAAFKGCGSSETSTPASS